MSVVSKALANERSTQTMTLEIRNDGQVHMAAINLEGCTDEDLRVVATHPAIHADVQRIAEILMNARTFRLAGNIAQAMRLERKADALYEVLPAVLRW